jgi:hypothetical protein
MASLYSNKKRNNRKERRGRREKRIKGFKAPTSWDTKSLPSLTLFLRSLMHLSGKSNIKKKRVLLFPVELVKRIKLTTRNIGHRERGNAGDGRKEGN